MRMIYHRMWMAGAVLAMASVQAQAQFGQGPTNPGPKLINLDTNWIPANNAWAIRGDIRAFGSSEKTFYGTLELTGGFQNGFGVTLRGSLANFVSFTGTGPTIRHGGSDMEAMVKYAVPQSNGLMVGAGVSLPNTPAQTHVFATGEAIYHFPTQGADLYLGGKGVFRKDSTLAGISGGFDVHAAPALDVIGDLTWPVTGHNTYNTSTGALERRAVYGVGLRFTPTMQMRQSVSFDLGVTNGIGGTTGFSLTPALGNSFGVYVGATMRY